MAGSLLITPARNTPASAASKLTSRVTSGFSAQSTVSTGREAKLRAAIDEQKAKLMQIRSERDQLAVLQRDVDAAKSADDAVTKRLTEQELADLIAFHRATRW